jgi:ketosteroid isomerase-like protein
MNEDERNLRSLLAAVDTGDMPCALELLPDDVRLRLGSAETVIGPAAAAAAFGALLETVTSLSHQIHHVWAADPPESAVICELTASIESHDGTRMTLPGVNVYRLRDAQDHRLPRPHGFVANSTVEVVVS